MFQGDVHRLYERLRRHFPTPPQGAVHALDYVREVRRYYAALAPDERRLLLAWAKKEESGIGLIPMVLSGVPLISLIFGPLIQQVLKPLPARVWVALWSVAALGIFAGFFVHQRQRAYTTLHIALLEQLGDEEAVTPDPEPGTR